MSFLTELWLPILLSAVFVFVASSVFHMVIQVHKGDYSQLPDEDRILAAMRDGRIARGTYMFPYCTSMKEMQNEELIAKWKRGPVGMMTVMDNGPFRMGKALGLWFGYCILVSIFAAYFTSFTLAPGAGYLETFRVAGTAAVLGYSVGVIPGSIWEGKSWLVSGKFMLEGLVYGLLTAGAFGWLAG